MKYKFYHSQLQQKEEGKGEGREKKKKGRAEGHTAIKTYDNHLGKPI